eukprot:1154081-Pelagomonas_calceolata.AAC.14
MQLHTGTHAKCVQKLQHQEHLQTAGLSLETPPSSYGTQPKKHRQTAGHSRVATNMQLPKVRRKTQIEHQPRDSLALSLGLPHCKLKGAGIILAVGFPGASVWERPSCCPLRDMTFQCQAQTVKSHEKSSNH